MAAIIMACSLLKSCCRSEANGDHSEIAFLAQAERCSQALLGLLEHFVINVPLQRDDSAHCHSHQPLTSDDGLVLQTTRFALSWINHHLRLQVFNASEIRSQRSDDQISSTASQDKCWSNFRACTFAEGCINKDDCAGAGAGISHCLTPLEGAEKIRESRR